MRNSTRDRLLYSAIFLIFVVSITVVAGWFLKVEALKSILPGWPSMKITTAVCFYVTGLILICVMHLRQGKIVEAQTILPIASFFLFVVVSTILVAVFLDLPSGLEFVFHQNIPQRVVEFPVSRPSYGTLAAFYLVGCAGLLSIYQYEILPSILKFLGWGVCMIGTVAVLGFMLDIPILYYAIGGNNSAMALHTAVLLCLTGLSFLLISQDAKD